MKLDSRTAKPGTDITMILANTANPMRLGPLAINLGTQGSLLRRAENDIYLLIEHN